MCPGMVVRAFPPRGVKMAYLAGFNGGIPYFRAAPSATVSPVRDCVGVSWACHGFVAGLALGQAAGVPVSTSSRKS